MAGTESKKDLGPIETVSMVRAAGSGMLSPPWGRNAQTVSSKPDVGEHVSLDWKRRAVVFEQYDEYKKLVARRYVPFERLDFADGVVE